MGYTCRRSISSRRASLTSSESMALISSSIFLEDNKPARLPRENSAVKSTMHQNAHQGARSRVHAIACPQLKGLMVFMLLGHFCLIRKPLRCATISNSNGTMNSIGRP